MNKSRQKRLAAEERAKRDRLWAEENARVDAQQALFVALPACPEVEALKQAMLDRAWWLLDNCKCEEADAILEFLPWPDARKLLDEYFFPEEAPAVPTAHERFIETCENPPPPTEEMKALVRDYGKFLK